MLFIPALIATVLTTLIFWKSKMRIGKLYSAMLIGIYTVYLGYMYNALKYDKV